MTYEEAYKNRKECLEYLRHNEAFVSPECLEAARLSVAALGKQIPTKPLPDVNFGFKGICPNCRARFIDDTTKYCGNCGQALDWSVSK